MFTPVFYLQCPAHPSHYLRREPAPISDRDNKVVARMLTTPHIREARVFDFRTDVDTFKTEHPEFATWTMIEGQE